jgi:alkylhydroperoxidase/carboxymuconolactone decarboxylase family protein YurZ
MPDTKYPATEAQRATGDWNAFRTTQEELDSAYLEAFPQFRSVPQNGPLDQKTKALIFIAINVATTHPWPSGARRHMANALEAGATKDEILGVIQPTPIMGLHSMAMGVPILLEKAEKAAGKDTARDARP